MTLSKSKATGTRFENKTMEYLEDYKPQRLAKEIGAPHDVSLVVAGETKFVQCKWRKGGFQMDYRWLKQHGAHYLFKHSPNQGTLVTMKVEELQWLLKKIEEGK